MRLPRRPYPLLVSVVAFAVYSSAPALGAEPEQPVAKPATGITATGAIFHGELDPHSKGVVTQYQFKYLRSTEACFPEAEGTPEPPAPAFGEEKEAVQAEAEDLEPGTTYSFCLVANPEGERALSSPLSFTTLSGPVKPLVLKGTTSASEVTTSSAILAATVNPEKEKTSYSFTYATNEALTENVKTVHGAQELEAIFHPDGVSVATGQVLAPTKTYYFRVNATNATGTTAGPVQHFTTAVEAPNTREAKSITGTSALLAGELNPGASATAGYEFTYKVGAGGACEGEGATTTPPGAAKTGQGIKVAQSIEGLEGSTEYTYCALAISGTEIKPGEPLTFTTSPEKPIVVSESGSAPTPFAATLEAQVNPENQTTMSCVFEYGISLVGENQKPCEQAALEGETTQTASISAKKLKAATKYRYRVVVGNPTGTSVGPEQELETPKAEKPAVEGEESSGITPFGATLDTQVNPKSEETSCVFEYAVKESTLVEHKGTKIPCSPPQFSASVEPQSGQAALTGLEPGKAYYYRVIVTDAAGITEGTVATFNTLSLKVPVIEEENASAITAFAATLHAPTNPEFQETSCTFEYAAKEATLAEHKGTEVACNPAQLGTAGTAQEAIAELRGLEPGKPYYYRVVVTNATGKVEGTPQEFETLTLKPPAVEGASATGVGAIEATLAAEVNPGYEQTSCRFEYAC